MDAVVSVTNLDARISNGRSTQVVQGVAFVPRGFLEEKGIAREDTLVAINVHAKGQA